MNHFDLYLTYWKSLYGFMQNALPSEYYGYDISIPYLLQGQYALKL
ncbi:hypothetical protein [Paenibacillus pabuli]